MNHHVHQIDAVWFLAILETKIVVLETRFQSTTKNKQNSYKILETISKNAYGKVTFNNMYCPWGFPYFFEDFCYTKVVCHLEYFIFI